MCQFYAQYILKNQTTPLVFFKFKGLSSAKNCLRPEKVLLIIFSSLENALRYN